MKIISLEQIKEILPAIDLIPAIEKSFVAYSQKKAVVPPVGELLLENGEVHIKYGFIRKDQFYVVKIASGFYQNAKLGLSSSNGLMLLFKQQTGELVSILLDEGHLTDVRTAVAGAVAAKFLAPENVSKIGIVGTGIQAKLQLKYLKKVTPCREALVWGRGEKQLKDFRTAMKHEGFSISTTLNANEILPNCNLVVTTTPSKSAILFAENIQKGTHITAIGSDTPQKQELDSRILQMADLIVADSISQCLERGEIHRAISAGDISKRGLVELGTIISKEKNGRTSDEQITVADLTGVAVQDIAISTAIFEML